MQSQISSMSNSKVGRATESFVYLFDNPFVDCFAAPGIFFILTFLYKAPSIFDGAIGHLRSCFRNNYSK